MARSRSVTAVVLDDDEFLALIRLATKEFRTPYDQGRYILRKALEEAGLLPNEETRRPANKTQEVQQ